MNIIIFGKKYDIMHAIQMSELMQFRLMKFILPESTDDYIAALQKGGADMIFVAERGGKRHGGRHSGARRMPKSGAGMVRRR